ncbi:MAG: sulfite exporter TauE/SafE family protein [Bacteroidota bacterium]
MTLFSYTFTTGDLILFYVVALLIGMAKTGVHGAGMAAVPLLAAVFGGRLSSGVLLPLLVLADVLGVRYYHAHASWKDLKVLFPWAALGVVGGAVAGAYINDQSFKAIMAVIILVSIGIMVWMQRGKREEVPQNKTFAAATGIAGGFTSMVGNLAGSVMAVYLLAMRLPKNAYIGTTAWFFLVTNWFKVPFHVFVWHTITFNTFLLALTGLPAIALGAWLGIVIVKRIPENAYRWFIIVTTLIAAVLMFI